MAIRKCSHRTNLHFVLATLLASSIHLCAQSAGDEASKALTRGDYRRAEAEYRKLLGQSPQSPEALSDLGVALEMQGKSSEAIYAFERALRLKQMPRTYALLAEEKCKTRDMDGARPMLARVTREYASDPSIVALVAPCYLELDEPIESVQAYNALISYSAYPQDLALMQLAKSYRRAASFFMAHLTHAADNSVYIKALAQARNTASANARSAFDDAAKASPYFRADLDFPAAVARWREHPDDAALLYLLSVLSGEQSMRQVEICEEKYPDSPYLAQLRAEMLAYQGREEEAVAEYDNLARSHPELPNLFYDEGMLFRTQRQWDKAIDAFHRQLVQDPGDERTAARMSEALIQVGRWKELEDFLSARVAATNTPLWAMQDYAEAEQNLDKPGQAITALVAAEKAFPDDAMVHYRLMRLYKQSGNVAAAEKELKLYRAIPKQN